LNDFNPKYPKNPKTLGERIRKARMDRGLKIKELAELIGVTPDSIINWEIRGVRPREKAYKRLRKILFFSKPF
jgi:transcriptional regulator with XRE-family HTH domain